MTAAPAFTALGADVLWCLGLGLLLGMARDLMGLLFGEGAIRRFCWDVLSFAAAAVLLCGFSAGVSASGLARWYMAGAALAGALAWKVAAEPFVHQLLYRLVQVALCPLRIFMNCLRLPCKRCWAVIQKHRKDKKKKKVAKKAKNRKKQLQTPSKIVYN